MQLNNQQHLFVESERGVSVSKDFGGDIFLYGDIYVFSEKFVEYQKDLFNDFYSELVDKLSEEGLELKTFQKFFENKLQELNSKLNVFAEKIKERESNLPIKGTLNIFFKETYMASMIGDVSISIFRNNKLSYSVRNDTSENEKVDVFSEFIEGETEDGDVIISCGGELKEIMEEDELQEVMSEADTDKQIVDSMKDVLSSRADKNLLTFLDFFRIRKEAVTAYSKVKGFKKNKKLKEDVNNFILKFRYPIIITVLVLIIVFLLVSVVKKFSGDNDNVEVYEGGEVVADFTISDLKKDISQFKRMEADSEEKIKKFNDIKEKINILEERDKWSRDVKELKDVLNKNYYKGFNIAVIDTLSDKNVSEFSETQKDGMGEIKSVSPISNKFVVGGNEGAVVGVFNEDIKGTLLEYDISKDIYGCAGNLVNNGVYCYSNGKDIFNITSDGLKQLTTAAGNFPDDIKDVGTYGSSNFYVLTEQESLNEKGVYISRYTNNPGSQINFGEGMNYQLSEDIHDEFKSDFASGFNSFAIDGTFLLWAEKDKGLYQLWREVNEGTSNIRARKIQLKGGPEPMDSYSEQVKVISDEDSRYVYLFDKENQSFTVYRSTPYKTNTSYTNSYELRYYFRLNFDMSDKEIKDVYVDSGNKPLLYLVTQNGLNKINLYDFFDTFSEDSEN